MDSKGNHNKGRVLVYEVLIKYRGELSETYLENLKSEIWEFMGDVSLSDITIRRRGQK